ncbi:ATP-binding protein [Streptomyces sp. MBT49]|uniref:ATP-binding protein n=1 Tax=unclassified Streptomyces TaxID=2593676 RepID=UPI0019099DD6|nr:MULTISPECIES: ATP-binding protein [unclassified Streptomyces]MBK3629072.1 ATP-binding protein [Streptomyces sp. MBT49]MBK3635399.1 ATP-binding protein [Streptomyces sp. MBT97]
MREEGLAPARGAVGPGPSGAPVPTASAARAHARSVVDARWNRAAREEDVIDLLLVVSELVTNALRHGGGLAGFETTPVADGIRVSVHDHSDEVPAAVPAPDPGRAGHRVGGYGWPLVVRLAREIVIDRLPTGGKTISVLMPIRTAGRPD